jgi:hypothetical protein
MLLSAWKTRVWEEADAIVGEGDGEGEVEVEREG